MIGISIIKLGRDTVRNRKQTA